jgi:hypothetical protein
MIYPKGIPIPTEQEVHVLDMRFPFRIDRWEDRIGQLERFSRGSNFEVGFPAAYETCYKAILGLDAGGVRVADRDPNVNGLVQLVRQESQPRYPDLKRWLTGIVPILRDYVATVRDASNELSRTRAEAIREFGDDSGKLDLDEFSPFSNEPKLHEKARSNRFIDDIEMSLDAIGYAADTCHRSIMELLGTRQPNRYAHPRIVTAYYDGISHTTSFTYYDSHGRLITWGTRER